MKDDSKNNINRTKNNKSDIEHIYNRLDTIELDIEFLSEYYDENLEQINKKLNSNSTSYEGLWSFFKFGLSIEILVLIMVLILKVLFSLV